MIGGSRRRWLAVMVALLLATAGTAGCIGTDDGTEDDEAGDVETSGADPAGTGNGTDSAPSNTTDDAEVQLETEEITFDGSGTGVGTDATGSNFWVVSQGYSQDFSPPETFENGTLTLEWAGTQTQGGLLVWLLDDDEGTVHVFEAPSSPYEVPLKADDDRVKGAAELLVLPTQGTPATAHVQVEWTGAFTFAVPVQAG